MKSRILFFVVFVFFISLVSACPEGEVCPEEQKYSYDQFQDDFTNDPLTAAQDHPQEYMKFIKENPEAVAQNIKAYETVVSQDVKFINQNKDAFNNYVNIKSNNFVSFIAIDSDFKSFDATTGKVETKGTDGKVAMDFTISGLAFFARSKYYSISSFEIDEHGRLLFDHQEDEILHLVKVRGELIDGKGGTYFQNARIERDDITLEITGNNRAIVESSCSENDPSDNCGSITIEVIDDPITLPSGILHKGRASVRNFDTVALFQSAKFQGKSGTIFETIDFEMSGYEETTMLITRGKCEKADACIQDNPRGNLIVAQPYQGKIKITTKDGRYKNIIVRPFQSKYVEEESEVSSTQEQTIDWKISLNIKKKDGSTAIIDFGDGPPITQGNMQLQSTVAHLFEHEDEKYPWIVSRSSSLNVGEVKTGWTESLVQLLDKGNVEELRVISQLSSLSDLELTDVIYESENLDVGSLEVLLSMYDPNVGLLPSYLESSPVVIHPNTDNHRLYWKIKGLLLMKKYETDNAIDFSRLPVYVEMKKRLLQEVKALDSIDSRIVPEILILSSENPSLQEEILDKTEAIYYPVDALSALNTDTLRRKLLSKKLIMGSDSDLRLLDSIPTELYEVAIKNMDFRQIYYDPEVGPKDEGKRFRRFFRALHNKPDVMKKVFEVLEGPKQSDYNPNIFAKVYLNNRFQEETSDLDLANRYSVALTAQRYLLRTGDEPSAENIEVVTGLILLQREQFSDHVILDDNTYYIPITHEEEMFYHPGLISRAREAGVQNIADQKLKGHNAKKRILSFVEESSDKGRTTIEFNNHGGPNHQWLSSGQIGQEVSDNLQNPAAISYVEFGDALIKRKKLDEVTVVIQSCFSKDYTDNLYRYLNEKGVQDMPTVITVTNRGEVGWIRGMQNRVTGEVTSSSTVLTEALTPSGERSKITGAEILRAESGAWNPQGGMIITDTTQDISVTVPLISDKAQQFQNPKTPGVIDLGSTFDDGANIPPQKPKKEEESPPPTFIEISQSEEAFNERLAIG